MGTPPEADGEVLLDLCHHVVSQRIHAWYRFVWTLFPFLSLEDGLGGVKAQRGDRLDGRKPQWYFEKCLAANEMAQVAG